jgi:hypothetical protein
LGAYPRNRLHLNAMLPWKPVAAIKTLRANVHYPLRHHHISAKMGQFQLDRVNFSKMRVRIVILL